MRNDWIEFVATAEDGECWPRLAGVEISQGLEVVSVERFADQIRMRYRPRPVHELKVWIARGCRLSG
jgi:hypothetical protein